MLPFTGRFGGMVLLLCALGRASAATEFFPLQDVRAGMRGIGKTVFSGGRIENFDVEILGVLENIGPKQSLILARLSGFVGMLTGYQPCVLIVITSGRMWPAILWIRWTPIWRVMYARQAGWSVWATPQAMTSSLCGGP